MAEVNGRPQLVIMPAIGDAAATLSQPGAA
jgi:hypothetical protein